MHHLNPTWLDCIDLVWVWGRLLPYIIMTLQSVIILFDSHHKPNPLLLLRTLIFFFHLRLTENALSLQLRQFRTWTNDQVWSTFFAWLRCSELTWMRIEEHFICKKCKVEVTRNILKFEQYRKKRSFIQRFFNFHTSDAGHRNDSFRTQASVIEGLVTQ